jgi:2,3-bisphosphoglycerate-independent phosphoglycerate mutase
MQELVDFLKEVGIGEIATVVGRYYAMDRDKRWERVEVALKGMILGEGEATEDPVAAVKARYERGGDKDKDEFLTPIIVGGDEGRIKGKKTKCPEAYVALANMLLQTTIPSSSSTTALIVRDRSLSCSETLIVPFCLTSPTPRSTSSSQ